MRVLGKRVLAKRVLGDGVLAKRVLGRAAGRLVRAATASPLRMATVTAAITPGMHLLVSRVVERRRVTWSSDYPAVLVGDPLLAIATGIASGVAGAEAVRAAPPLRRPLVGVMVGGAAAFGAWQMADELRRGVYTRSQVFSPSKLWHQFVVYPALTPMVSAAMLAATQQARRPQASTTERVAVAAAWSACGVWAGLVVEAMRNPRDGHGSFDWTRPLGWARPLGCTRPFGLATGRSDRHR